MQTINLDLTPYPSGVTATHLLYDYTETTVAVTTDTGEVITGTLETAADPLPGTGEGSVVVIWTGPIWRKQMRYVPVADIVTIQAADKPPHLNDRRVLWRLATSLIATLQYRPDLRELSDTERAYARGLAHALQVASQSSMTDYISHEYRDRDLDEIAAAYAYARQIDADRSAWGEEETRAEESMPPDTDTERRPVGRPSVGPEVKTRVTDEERSALEAEAAEQGVPRSVMLRRLVQALAAERARR